jgi:hypothetical protein
LNSRSGILGKFGQRSSVRDETRMVMFPERTSTS